MWSAIRDVRTKLAVHEKSLKHRKAEGLITKGQRIRIIGESDFRHFCGSAVRQTKVNPTPLGCDANRKEKRVEAGMFCGKCGKPIDPADSFCRHCGRAAEPKAPAARIVGVKISTKQKGGQLGFLTAVLRGWRASGSAGYVALGAVLLLGWIILSNLGGLFHSNQQPEQNKPASVEGNSAKATPSIPALPTECFMTVHAERGSDGAIYLIGSTNLPDGLHIGVMLLNGAHRPGKLDVMAMRLNIRDRLFPLTFDVYAKSGAFRSAGLMDGNRPYPPGKHEVRFQAFFQPLYTDPRQNWQSASVLAVIGGKGEKLHGPIIKKTDPDVSDSAQMLDYTAYPIFPPIAEATQAIELVKTSPAYAAKHVEDVIAFWMLPGGGAHPAKGWSARLTGKQTYTVSFDFVTDDKEGEHQALWSVNMATRKVQYTNMAAKGLR